MININKPPSVLAITLNWKQPEMTIECVNSLRKMNYPNLDILVIDQESNIHSAELLREHLPMSSLVFLEENVGFAKGCNIGLNLAAEKNYDYALLINNDAFPAPDMLEVLIAEAKPDIALLSPKIYYESERDRIWFANGRRQPKTLELRDTGRGEIDSQKWKHSRDVDYLLGTCLLANLKVISQIGFLNEHYFMYYEDLDWSIRISSKKYRLRLVSEAHLYHRVAVSSGGINSPKRVYNLSRSSIIFWKSHAAIGNLWMIIFVRLLSLIKTTLKFAAAFQGEQLISYYKGLRDGWIV